MRWLEPLNSGLKLQRSHSENPRQTGTRVRGMRGHPRVWKRLKTLKPDGSGMWVILVIVRPFFSSVLSVALALNNLEWDKAGT